MKSRRACFLLLAVLVCACNQSTTFVAPSFVPLAVTFRYQHVASVPTAGMQLIAAYVHCSDSIINIPVSCRLTEDSPNTFVCHDDKFITGVCGTGRDDRTWVDILTPANVLVAELAHDIYLNDTRLLRTNVFGGGYENAFVQLAPRSRIF